MEYKTKIKVNLLKLEEIIPQLEAEYNVIGNRDTTEGRSKFTVWNNILKFYQKTQLDYKWKRNDVPFTFLESEPGYRVLEIKGAAVGNSARIYNTPSITSMPRPFRKSIEPINPENVFVYFDIKAAEFIYNCNLCGMDDVLEDYRQGNDVYLKYVKLFPGIPRDVIKTIIIGFMYNITPYRISKLTGMSENEAMRILDRMDKILYQIAYNKLLIIQQAKTLNGYFAYKGKELVKVSDIEGEFSPERALSTMIQSGLGFWMQQLVEILKPKIKGTLLTIFDAVLAEVKPENVERYKNYIQKVIAPFRAEFLVGKNFLELL